MLLRRHLSVEPGISAPHPRQNKSVNNILSYKIYGIEIVSAFFLVKSILLRHQRSYWIIDK